MLKIGMIGKWHVHAEGYANDFNAQSDSKVTAVWDDDVSRGREWASRLNVPFYSELGDMLEKADIDAVCVCCKTSEHERAITQAAMHGKHIFTEKVMCLDVDACDRAAEAIKANNVVFTISFPHRCFPQNLYIKDAIDKGMLGKITLLRVRNCHDGAVRNWLPDYWYDPETTGGGAMMDLGAHPMYLASWMLGRPQSVISSFSRLTGRAVDDDATSILSFESGARAIVETGLVSPFSPQICELYGTNGAILCEAGRLRIRTNETHGWLEPELPKALPEPFRQFIDSVLYGAPVAFGTSEARELTLMMQKAYEAERLGRRVSF